MNRRELMGIAAEVLVRKRIDDECARQKADGTYGQPGSSTAKTIKQSAMKPKEAESELGSMG